MPEISRFYGIWFENGLMRTAPNCSTVGKPPKPERFFPKFRRLIKMRCMQQQKTNDRPPYVIPPKLVEATYAGGYKIHFRFADGMSATVDLGDQLYGEVFEPLKDTDFFKRFHITEGSETIEWPNRADFAPSFLYEEVLFNQTNSRLHPAKHWH